MLENYGQAVESALRDLGGQEHYVAGAQLLVAVQKEAEPIGDFRGELRAANIKFSKYLRQYLPHLRVHLRGAADMMIGFDGARFEVPGGAGEFRPDVYNAFAKASPQPVVYDVPNDEFTSSNVNGIPVPQADRAELLSERSRFIASIAIDQHAKNVLTAALNGENPFAAFRDALESSGLLSAWYVYKNRQTRTAIEKWAIDNGLPLKESWFRSAAKLDVKSAMIRMIALMTDDEVRSLQVPFRVVEAHLRERT
jgi:predicted Fe-Mo cluster-binding NifX family protein